MIDHTGVGITDFPASKAFYDAAMAPLGASLLMTVPEEFTGSAAVVGCGRITTRTITRPSCLIPTATISRRSAMRRSEEQAR